MNLNIILLMVIFCCVQSVESTLRFSAIRFYDPPIAEADGMTLGLLQASFIDIDNNNASNWLPICELSYKTSQLACDQLLPQKYDTFFAGSSIASRDIYGVGYCMDVDCDSGSPTQLSECDVTLSSDVNMISYLICLDKPSNRNCWVTDSNMPMYCIDPKFYETQGQVFTWGLITLSILIPVLVLFGFLLGDAQRIINQRVSEASVSGEEGCLGMQRKTITAR